MACMWEEGVRGRDRKVGGPESLTKEMINIQYPISNVQCSSFYLITWKLNIENWTLFIKKVIDVSTPIQGDHTIKYDTTSVYPVTLW